MQRNLTLCRRQLDIKMHPKHVHFKGHWHWGVFSGHSPKDSSRNSRHVPKRIPRRLPTGWYSSTKCAVGCVNVSHMPLLGLHHAIIPILPPFPNPSWLLINQPRKLFFLFVTICFNSFHVFHYLSNELASLQRNFVYTLMSYFPYLWPEQIPQYAFN